MDGGGQHGRPAARQHRGGALLRRRSGDAAQDARRLRCGRLLHPDRARPDHRRGLGAGALRRARADHRYAGSAGRGAGTPAGRKPADRGRCGAAVAPARAEDGGRAGGNPAPRAGAAVSQTPGRDRQPAPAAAAGPGAGRGAGRVARSRTALSRRAARGRAGSACRDPAADPDRSRRAVVPRARDRPARLAAGALRGIPGRRACRAIAGRDRRPGPLAGSHRAPVRRAARDARCRVRLRRLRADRGMARTDGGRAEGVGGRRGARDFAAAFARPAARAARRR